MKFDINNIDNLKNIIHSISHGMYVTDLNRNIIFWNKKAEEITGWTIKEVTGRPCSDNILCHINHNGKLLCSTDFCPLHSAIITKNTSMKPQIVYAQTKDQRRIPLYTTVTPLFNKQKEIIGGLEMFSLAEEEVKEFETAQKIQLQLVGKNIKLFRTTKELDCNYIYISSDMLGGDFLDVFKIDDSHYLIAVADVVGHGLSAALLTGMIKSIIQTAIKGELQNIDEYLERIEKNFSGYNIKDIYFTLQLSLYSKKDDTIEIINAGHTYPLLISKNKFEIIKIKGPAIGWGLPLSYEKTKLNLSNGDMLLYYTDGLYGFETINNKIFTEEDFYKVVKTTKDISIKVLLNKIYYTIYSESKQVDKFDDIAMFAIKF